MCDRTKEFLTIAEFQVKIKGPDNVSKRPDVTKARSAFHEATLDVAGGIKKTTVLLQTLTKMVKRQGLFDDSADEVNGLIFRIKQDLGELNSKCDSAQAIADVKKSGSSSQNASHSGAVVTQLKSNLMVATKDFKSALESRSVNLKQLDTRKSELMGNSVLSPMRQMAKTAELTSKNGPQGGPVNSFVNPYQQLANTDSSSTAATSTASSSSSPWNNNKLQQTQMLVAPPSAELQYYESRETAATEVEKTIGELGQIFKRLSEMIASQEGLVTRIDEDVENAVQQTDNARDLLAKAYEAVSSNRGMYMKMSAILIIFILFFTLFLM